MKLSEDRILNSTGTANMLGVTRQTLLNWRNTGIGPSYISVGGKKRRIVRYRESAVHKWVKENTVNLDGPPKGRSYTMEVSDDAV